MNTRMIVTVALAVVLILVVMGVTGVMAASSGEIDKYEEQVAWSYPIDTVQSIKAIDLTGDGQNNVFVQNPNTIAVLDGSGNEVFRQSFPGPGIVSTMGDMNGDNVEDMVVAQEVGGGAQVTALTGNGSVLWDVSISGITGPSRAANARFASGSQLIVGDNDGMLVALASLTGQELWRRQLTTGSYIRGMDEVEIGGQRQFIAASYSGQVGAFDNQGNPLWGYNLTQDLRRMRTFDLDGGGAEVLVGGEGGRFVILRGNGDGEIASQNLGQGIAEIRAGELDGDPATQELVVGGREGGVWAFSADGRELWSRSVGARVRDVSITDTNGDGTPEIIVGTRNGSLAVLDPATGDSFDLASYPGDIAKLDAGTLGDGTSLLVSDQQGVRALGVTRQVAPAWYNPLLAGGLISFVIAGLAWFVATLPQKPTIRAEATDLSVEGLKARRMMLHEAIADVERLRNEGQMPTNAYLERLKQLRGELADTEAGLLKAGEKLQVETIKCPNCGGSLSLGVDRCDYCGQVIMY